MGRICQSSTPLFQRLLFSPQDGRNADCVDEKSSSYVPLVIHLMLLAEEIICWTLTTLGSNHARLTTFITILYSLCESLVIREPWGGEEQLGNCTRVDHSRATDFLRSQGYNSEPISKVQRLFPSWIIKLLGPEILERWSNTNCCIYIHHSLRSKVNYSKSPGESFSHLKSSLHKLLEDVGDRFTGK